MRTRHVVAGESGPPLYVRGCGRGRHRSVRASRAPTPQRATRRHGAASRQEILTEEERSFQSASNLNVQSSEQEYN